MRKVSWQPLQLSAAAPNATLTSVASLLGCSKSTVDNELRRALSAIRQHSASAEEAESVYTEVLDTAEISS